MGFLVAGLAAFGQLDCEGWHRVAGELGDAGPAVGRQWVDESASVALGIAPATGAFREPGGAAGLAVAVDGSIEGEPDAAVAVLAAYRQEGAPGLTRLRGDYAYALWDPGARHLLVGCDALGLRAPAFIWNGRTFLLSTRALALLRHPEVHPAWNRAYLAHMLAGVWSGAPEATAFAGVRRMRGGELIRVSARGIEWLAGDRLAFQPARMRSDDAVCQLGQILDRAVDERARPHAWAVALSGGVDSCTVAASLARARPDFHAFSLVVREGEAGRDPALLATVAAFPGIRHHPVPLPDTSGEPGQGMVFDDPIVAGPVLQPGRIALLQAVRDAGLWQVFDGEGGDELFDLAWRPSDLIRGMAIGRVLAGIAAAAPRRRLVRDLLWGGGGPASRLPFERATKRARARRPWLAAPFWESKGLAEAWEEARALARLRTARERLPGILGAHGRYWRAQEMERRAAGVEGASPLLDRRIVEFIGSLHPAVAMDLSESKALLRRLAGRRVPAAVARRSKREPLSDWLIQRWLAVDANMVRMTERIRSSGVLREFVAPVAVASAAQQARRIPGPNWLASSLVELGAIVEWVTAIEARFGL